MAIGGNIKVTLTLDDAGFTVKSQQAAKGIQSMNTEIKGFSGGLEKAEATIRKFGDNVQTVSRNFTALNGYAKSASKTLGELASSGAALDKTTASLVTSFTNLQGIVSQLASKLTSATDSMGKANNAGAGLARTNRDVGTSSQAAADGMTRQERAAKNLGTAQQQTTKQIQLSALASKDAAASQLATEFSKNERLVANKKTALASMLRAEQQYQRQLEEAKARAMATSMQIDGRRLPNGRMTSVNSDYMRDLRVQLELEQRQVQALQQSVNLIGQETAKMQGTITATQQRNAAIREGINLRERDLANVNRYQSALRDGNQAILNAEKARRAEIQAQNAAVREQMNMVKSLAALWAGIKIEGALVGTLATAEKYNNVVQRVRAANMGGQAGVESTLAGGQALAKKQGNLSDVEALRIYMGVQTGLQTTDRHELDAVAPQIATVLSDLKQLFPESIHNFENASRNLTGVIETMGITKDQGKQIEVLNNIYKAIVASGGKVTTDDVETLMRGGGLGNAVNKSSDYLLYAIAMSNALKVMGGGGSGGQGGVSSQGTMERMLLKLSSGGSRLTKQGLTNMTDFGFIDTQRLNQANPKGLSKNHTAVPWVNSGVAQENIYEYARWFGQELRKQMADPNNKKADRFFDKGADRNDPRAQATASSRFIDQSIGSKNAPEMLKIFANRDATERMDREVVNARNAKGPNETKGDLDQTYTQSLNRMSAQFENLGKTIGNMLQQYAIPVIDWITNLTQAVDNFMKGNPLSAEFTLWGVAIAGAVLAFKGLTGTIGTVGALFRLMTGMGGAGSAAAAGAAAAGRGFLGMTGPATAARNAVTGVGGAWRTMATNIATRNATLMTATNGVVTMGGTFRMFGTVIGNTLGFIGKSFMRAIPFVGWLLLAWDLGQILLSFEVGGAKISEWLTKWWGDLMSFAKTKWEEFKSIFNSDEADDKATAAAIAKIKAEADARGKAFADQRKLNEQQKADNDKKQAENTAAAAAGTASVSEGNPDLPSGYGAPLVPGPTADNSGEALNYGQDKPKRGFEDPFTSSLAEMRKNATIAAQKAGAAIADTGNDLTSEARTAFQEKWIAGDFDPGHDPNKRQFKGADGGVDWNAKGAAGSPQDWVDQYVEMKKAEEQLKSMQFVKQRSVAAEEDFRNAMERTSGETGKQNRDLAALERELARAGERLKTGTQDWAAWSAEKNKALEIKSGAILVNFSADFAEGDRKSQADLAPDGFGKQTAEMDNAILKDREQYQQLADAHKKYYDDELAAYKEQLATKQIDNALYTQKVTDATERYTSSAEKAETAYTQHVLVQNQLRARAAETATQKQTRDWQNTYAALDTASAKWANSMIDNLQTALEGGRSDWKSFLRGMFSDMLSIKLKEGLGGIVNNLFGGISQMLNGSLFKNASTAGSGGGLMSGLSTIGGGVASMFGGGTGAAASNAGTTVGGAAGTGANASPVAAATAGLATAATTATTGLQNMSQTGIMGAITSIGQWIVSLFTGTTATAVKAGADEIGATAAITLSTAMFEAAMAATNLAISLTAAATTSTATAAFANGGIMSSAGSLPLKAYANGGVANTPQLALFGEGRMNEAYVPLPDGRSIPVTMKGDASTTAGAGGTINSVMIEINVTGGGDDSTSTTSKSGNSQDSTWDTMAQRIKGIVMEVMTNEKRPNGILTK